MRHKISYADLDQFQSTVCSSYKVYKMLRHVALVNIYLYAVTNGKRNSQFIQNIHQQLPKIRILLFS